MRTISTSSYCPISARSGGTTSSSTASTSSTAVSCEAKGLAYKFARFWALPWERQHERFGKRSLSPKIGNSLFGSHSRDRVRAENLRALLAADLKSAIDDKRTAGGLVTGTPRFGSRPRGGHPGAAPGRDAAPPQPRPGWKAQLR